MNFVELLDTNLKVITPEYMRRIVTPLKSIEKGVIDSYRSSIERSEEKSALVIRIYSVEDICCPLTIVFGIGGFSRFFYFAFGESDVTWEETIDDDDEAESAENAFRKYLETPVKEVRTMVEDRLAKLTYSYTFVVDGKRETFKDSSSRMVIWPWRKRQRIQKTYRPWLGADN